MSVKLHFDIGDTEGPASRAHLQFDLSLESVAATAAFALPAILLAGIAVPNELQTLQATASFTLTIPGVTGVATRVNQIVAMGVAKYSRRNASESLKISAWDAPARRSSVGSSSHSVYNKRSRVASSDTSLPDSLSAQHAASWNDPEPLSNSGIGSWDRSDKTSLSTDSEWDKSDATHKKASSDISLYDRTYSKEVSAWNLGVKTSRKSISSWIDWDADHLRSKAIWTLYGDLYWRNYVEYHRPPNPPPDRVSGLPVRLFFYSPGWPVPDGANCRLHFGGDFYQNRFKRKNMITSMSLSLLPGLEPIRFQTMEIDFSQDSYSRLLRATIIGAQSYNLVKPRDDFQPIEVRAVLNGYTFDFVVQECTGVRAAADEVWTLNAQSSIVYLGAPYLPNRDYLETQARTVHQLADQELGYTDFTLTWDVANWTVPIGVWSYQNLTPIDALRRLVSSVGGYLSDDPVDHEIIAGYRYPIPPWEWPVQVPVTTLTSSMARSLTSQNERRSNVNRVISSGGGVGKVRVTSPRSGTAGDVVKYIETDGLICHVTAGTERNRQELAASGHHIDYVMDDIPIQPAPEPPGILQLGDLVDVVWGGETFRAQVIGNKLSARAGSLTQSVTLDRFYG